MKTFIILGALVITTGAFAQTRPQLPKVDQEKVESQLKEQSTSGKQAVKEYVDQKKDETTQKVIQEIPKGSEFVDKAKDMVNSQDKEEMVEGKVSEGNAAVAKAKAKEVKTEAEAEEMIETSKEETKATVTSIGTKMVTAREKLTEKLASGELTQAQHDEKLAKLMDFEKRKSSIINSMK